MTPLQLLHFTVSLYEKHVHEDERSKHYHAVVNSDWHDVVLRKGTSAFLRGTMQLVNELLHVKESAADRHAITRAVLIFQEPTSEIRKRSASKNFPTDATTCRQLLVDEAMGCS